MRSMSRSRSLRSTALAALSLAALALAAPTTHAQSAVQTGAIDAPSAKVFPFLGARFGVPQRFSISGGLGLDLDPNSAPNEPSRELLLALAPGMGAERASLTFVHSTGRFGGGIAGGLTAIRTVSRPWNAPANATYAGMDLSILPIIAIGPRIGLLRRVSAPTNDRAWLWTMDFGFGF